MISSINNAHTSQNISMVNRYNNVRSSKAAEEANESASERVAESKSQKPETTSNHTIDAYA